MKTYRAKTPRRWLLSLGRLTLALLSSLTVFAAARADFRDDYDRAVAEYQKASNRSNYEAVAARFMALSKRDDAGSLRDNVFYWLGESHYDLKDYLKALDCFERVLLHPQTPKEESARFKVAVCYANLGWIEAAKWELSGFLRDYPASQLTQRARAELQNLTEKGR